MRLKVPLTSSFPDQLVTIDLHFLAVRRGQAVQELEREAEAYAQLALAEGDARAAMALGTADGLRQRAGLRAWPLTRRGEAELVTRAAQEIDPEVFKDAFAAGPELSQREAVALVGGDSSRDGDREGGETSSKQE
jgi:hypothetical protein